MSSKLLLIFIFLLLSCGVKKDPVAPAQDQDLFIKSFMNTEVSAKLLQKKEDEEEAKKKKAKKKSKD